ncbi:MAG TPA: hypothetical protein DFK11_11610 [Lachnospiraceae bacterium]|nr:hypothetical protein [Lachnospiraceae bacterium]
MREKMNKIGNLCFWIALVIESVIVMIDKSAYINPWEGKLFRLTFVLFCIKVITTQYSKKEWLAIAIAGILVSISYLVNDKDEVVRAAVFVISCKNIDVKKILKVVLGITLAGSVILFVLAASGTFGAMTMTANFGRGPFPGIVETRYCFGMGHPNAFQCMMYMMTVLCLYIYIERMKWYHFVLLFLINVITYHYTDSNTAMLVIGATIIGAAIMKYVPILKNLKWIYWLSAAFVLALVIFSAVGSYTGRETQFMYDLDQVLNGRFQYAHAIENARVENWTLFSNRLNTEFFDQGFIRLFYWYGIIPGIMYVLANLYLIYQSYQKRDCMLLIIVVGFSLFSLMEAHLISVYILRNYLLVLLGYYWYQPFEKREKKNG